MRMAIVPNYVRDIINTKLDEALAGRSVPDADRNQMYCDLLNYYDDHGEIPEFTVSRLLDSNGP